MPQIRGEQIQDSTITNSDILDGTILVSDLNQEVIDYFHQEVVDYFHQKIVSISTNVFSTTSTTLQATGLQVSLLSGFTYLITGRILFSTVAKKTGFGLALNGPTNSFYCGNFLIPESSIYAAPKFVSSSNFLDTSVVTSGVANVDTPYMSQIEGIIKPTVSGDLQVYIRSEVNGSSVSMLVGSTIQVERLP